MHTIYQMYFTGTEQNVKKFGTLVNQKETSGAQGREPRGKKDKQAIHHAVLSQPR